MCGRGEVAREKESGGGGGVLWIKVSQDNHGGRGRKDVLAGPGLLTSCVPDEI